HGKGFGAGHRLLQHARQMSGSEVGFAEENEDHCLGMELANLGNLGGSMAIACANFAQAFARHAIEAIDRLAMIARRDQQLVERSPVVSPVEIETDTLAKFGLINFATPPFFEDVLVSGEDGFANEDDVGCMQSIVKLLAI